MRRSIRTILAGTLATSMAVISSVAVVGASGKATPGVSATQVSLGAIVTKTGFLAADFAPYIEGVEAYLNYVDNTLHGVNGRQVVLTDVQDDASNPTTDVSETRAMATDKNIFAIVGYATAFFDSKDLAKSGIPVFGYATSSNWQGPKNFFADYGSVVNYKSSVPDFAYVAKQVGATKVAVLSYPKVLAGASYSECLDAVKGLKAYHDSVVYSNLDDGVYSTSYSADVSKMITDKVGMIISCMQASDDITLATDMHEQGMTAVPQVWLDGYDRSLLASDYAYMSNVYLLLQHIPFEAATAFPGSYPGLTLYFDQMQASGYGNDEFADVALAGWESASLFIQGLQAAGKNPTRTSILAALNKITNDVGGPTGYGVSAPTDWKIAHTTDRSPACVTFVKTEDTTSSADAKFQMVFNTGSNPWVCFPLGKTANLSKPVAPPRGTPGA